MLDILWDILFPKKCVTCSMEGDFICSGCLSSVVAVKEPYCPGCRANSLYGEVCGYCRQSWFFDGVTVASEYDGAIKDLIHSYKYENLKAVSDILVLFLTSAFNKHKVQIGFDEEWLVVFVPMTKEKELDRGYNQSGLLASGVAKYFDIKLVQGGLVKTRATLSQMKLKRSQRLLNVADSFLCSGDVFVGRSIILVDDVTTTGATLSECARELKRAGAVKVWGLVLSRGE